jgi:hypothetical protein
MLPNPDCATLVSSSFTVAWITAIVLVTGSACLAQVAGGTISGSVLDISSEAIAETQIAVRNSEMAILRSEDADTVHVDPNRAIFGALSPSEWAGRGPQNTNEDFFTCHASTLVLRRPVQKP